jgi:hypothetical protein
MVSEKVEELLKQGEIQYYFLINECGGFIWRMNHDLADDRIDLPTDPEERKKAITEIDNDIKEMRTIQAFVVSKLPDVGVQNPLMDDSKPSEEYWKWFHWWNDYVNSMSQEKWSELSIKIEAKEDISAWRPSGDWRIKPTHE